MGSDMKLIWMIVIIIVIIIVATLIFRNQYKTQEERDAHMNNLYLLIGVAIAVVLVVGYMWGNGDDTQEHGIGDSVRGWWRSKREQREAGADARRAAAREVKERQRDEKRQSREDYETGRRVREGASQATGSARGL